MENENLGKIFLVLESVGCSKAAAEAKRARETQTKIGQIEDFT